MDDAWFHTLTSPPAAVEEKPRQHKRRATLLQQPAEQRADAAVVEAIAEVSEEDRAWKSGPPKATLARRAQSYSNFYEVVAARGLKEHSSATRRDSPGRTAKPRRDVELDFDAEFTSLEERLIEESHAGYQTYYEQLLLSESHLDTLLASTSSTLSLLSELSHTFQAVEAQTGAFRQQCDDLISEQVRLSSLAVAPDENDAGYAAYLEPMTRRLRAWVGLADRSATLDQEVVEAAYARQGSRPSLASRTS
ncbi:hypothetical protein LTR08_002829 [Meristemomyces frigidus]|nr:hypothetical protein LTR08_002829 [Meristemomyces frigidus]